MPDKMPIAAAVPESFLDLIEIVTSTRTYRLRATVPEIEGAATPTDAASKPVVRTLRSEALRWTYVLRSRERWLGNASERDAREADAIDTLKAFGLTEADLVAITGGDRAVVVRMPFVAEAQGWEGRVFPWEYVIAAATRHYRKSIDQRVTVMREVIYPKRTVALPRTHHRPVRFLFVQSAPGELRDAWDFSGEQRRLKRVLPKEMRFEVLENPTPAELSARVTSAKPDVIHFSGFGNMQGLRELRKVTRTGSRVHVLDDREEAPAGAGVDDGIERDLLDLLDNERGVADGYLMSASDGSPLVVPFTRFAEIVKGKRTQPAYLVSLGIPNSAARIAPLLVGRESALAAVGFQDVIDDTFAEYFFELLYGGLRNSRWNLPRAFLDTWAYLRSDPEKKRPTGTGIALWAGAPLLEPGLGTVAKKIEYTGRMPKELDCDVESISELNYAVLHNRGQLFKRFTILKGRNTPPDAQIAVDVTAHLGMERASFSRQFPASIARWDLEKEVHIPLTASLARSVREAVNSTLVVEVREDQLVRFRNSYPLRLLPVDQWKDDENDGKWLPSFVQPRDPAVVKAVESAQRYVRVLRDDPSAGFEGYQAAPDATEDQTARSGPAGAGDLGDAAARLAARLHQSTAELQRASRQPAPASTDDDPRVALRHVHRPRAIARVVPRTRRHLSGDLPARRPCAAGLLAAQRIPGKLPHVAPERCAHLHLGRPAELVGLGRATRRLAGGHRRVQRDHAAHPRARAGADRDRAPHRELRLRRSDRSGHRGARGARRFLFDARRGHRAREQGDAVADHGRGRMSA